LRSPKSELEPLNQEPEQANNTKSLQSITDGDLPFMARRSLLIKLFQALAFTQAMKVSSPNSTNGDFMKNYQFKGGLGVK
jgi:hypothetical protein